MLYAKSASLLAASALALVLALPPAPAQARDGWGGAVAAGVMMGVVGGMMMGHAQRGPRYHTRTQRAPKSARRHRQTPEPTKTASDPFASGGAQAAGYTGIKPTGAVPVNGVQVPASVTTTAPAGTAPTP